MGRTQRECDPDLCLHVSGHVALPAFFASLGYSKCPRLQCGACLHPGEVAVRVQRPHGRRSQQTETGCA